MRLLAHYVVLICLVFLTYCHTANAQSRTKVRKKYDYLLYLPKAYSSTPTDTYPLVIYLHGGSQKGHDLTKLKTFGLPYLVDKGHDFKFIIASPQCPDNTYWSTENWFDSLYATLRSTYRIDTNRIYVTGISMGGFGAWQVAMDHPDTFAAIVPLCGGCNDSTEVCRIKHIPIWTFHGTADDQIPISETELLVTRLQACKGRIKFTRLEKEGHSIQYLYENQAIYDWMLKQHK